MARLNEARRGIRQGKCHAGHASVTAYNAYHHTSTLHAYIQQSYATSTIEHIQASTTLDG